MVACVLIWAAAIYCHTRWFDSGVIVLSGIGVHFDNGKHDLIRMPDSSFTNLVLPLFNN